MSSIAEAAPSSLRRRRATWPAGALGLIGILALTVFGCTRSDAPRGVEWRTTQTQGMSLSLPTSFTVFTDQQMLVEEMRRLGHAEQAEIVASFRNDPYSFVLFGTEPQYQTGFTSTALVFKAPSMGLSLKEFADAFAESFQQGPKEITGESRQEVGAGRYPTVRLDMEFPMSGFGVSRGWYFVIDRGSEMWFVTFDFPASEVARMRPIWNRSLDSMTLPRSS